MDTMTTTDYQIEEDYHTRYEACYDTALSEFYSSIEEDKQSFEHYLDDTPISEVDVKVILLIATSIKLMSLKSDFHYSDDYDQIDYDFHKELSAMLLDEYGWEM
jgi:hypothetical protein